MQQITIPELEEAADAILLARGMEAKTVLALKRQLENLHFRVIVAGTVRAALAAACSEKAALLLAPAGDEAAALFWRLQQLHTPSARPFCIAIMEEDRAESALVLDMLTAGADDCLVWPFGTRLLAQRLEQLPVAA